jgi:adenosine deaminase
MSWYPEATQHTLYQRLPKVDLHRHLEGSIRLSTMMDVAKVYSITLPLRPDLRSLVAMQATDRLDADTFLAKFQVLRLFYRSPEVIARITAEAIEDAAADGVQYMDLHFTPVALSRYQGFLLSDVMDWVARSAADAARKYAVIVRLIASVNRHESIQLAEQVVRLAAERRHLGIVGVDLAGNEAEYSGRPFVGLFREAHAAGLALAVHAGEWGGAENVRMALEEMQADRVIHGVRVMEDPSVVALARERNIPFAVCLTSNVQTGVVSSLEQHPLLAMLLAGLNISINTDDPSISQIALSDEYWLACERLGLPHSILAERILAAAEAAFLTPTEHTDLLRRLRQGLSAGGL